MQWENQFATIETYKNVDFYFYKALIWTLLAYLFKDGLQMNHVTAYKIVNKDNYIINVILKKK